MFSAADVPTVHSCARAMSVPWNLMTAGLVADGRRVMPADAA